MIGIIGDVHGRYDDMFKIIRAHPDVTHWFQPEDLGGNGVLYPDLPDNSFYIQGNHENWDDIGGRNFLINGEARLFWHHDLAFTVVVLGSNYSTRWYTRDRGCLYGGRRGHYVDSEVKRLLGTEMTVDIPLTHRAPSPYCKYGKDTGQPTITEVLKHLRHKIHFFGHYYYDSDSAIEGIRSIGTDYPGRPFWFYHL